MKQAEQSKRYIIKYSTGILSHSLLTVSTYARGRFNAEMQAFRTCNRMGYTVLNIEKVQ